jgi:hypothetical protein
LNFKPSAAAGGEKTTPRNIVQSNAPAVADTQTFAEALTRLIFISPSHTSLDSPNRDSAKVIPLAIRFSALKLTFL